MPKFLEVTDKLAARQAINADTLVSAKDFGVVGDGVADDTIPLQNWINSLVDNVYPYQGKQGFLPEGNYKITSTLLIPHGYGWAILGENSNSTAIIQATSNIPVLQIGTAGNASHSYSLKNLKLSYANAQSSSNTAANCIYFQGDGDSTAYFAEFRNLRFSNGYYALKAVAASAGPWGCEFDNLSMQTMSGGFLDETGCNNAPDNRWGRLTLFCEDSIGPIFKNWNESSASIAALEFLVADSGAKLIETAEGFNADIGVIKLENGSYTGAGKPLFDFRSSHWVRIGDLRICGNDMTFATGHVIIQAGYGLGEASSYVHVNTLRAEATSLTGDCYAVNSPGSPPYGRIEIGSVQLANGWQLQDTAATATADVLTVKSWVNGAVSDNRGDANYTVTVGDPNIALFTTAFTAQRTITLPAVTGNNLCGGLYYELLFDGAINGSNTALIKQGSTTIRTQTVDKVKLRFVWKRYVGWVLTDVSNLLTLPVAYGGTGAATLTGLVVGNGTAAFTTKTAPSGSVVGTSDVQALSGKYFDDNTTFRHNITLNAANIDYPGVYFGPSSAASLAYTKDGGYITGLSTNKSMVLSHTDGDIIITNRTAAKSIVFGSGGTSDVRRMKIDADGNVIIGNGSSALSTTATNGFLYVDSCAGPPTGTPTSITGTVPMVVDTSASKLYFYVDGAWKGVTLT